MSPDQDRVGDYVRRALPRALLRAGVDWPCAVEWDEAAVRASITRGELVIRTTHQFRLWWLPTTKRTADDITRRLVEVLSGWWKIYRDVDETGRLHATLWRHPSGALYVDSLPDGEAVAVVLAPGCVFGVRGAGGPRKIDRYGEVIALRPDEAVALGWVQIGVGSG